MTFSFHAAAEQELNDAVDYYKRANNHNCSDAPQQKAGILEGQKLEVKMQNLG